MEAEMCGLSLEPRNEVSSVALFVVVLADIFVSCAGEGLKAKARQVKSRVAGSLRLATQALSKSALGEYCRRMKARLGAPEAITATAHKLASILHHLIKHRCAYDQSIFAQEEELHRKRREKNKPPSSASNSPLYRVITS
jgi:hypothetical protein